MPLFARGQDVPDAAVAMQVSGGQLSTKQIVGLDSSLMIARRSPGYHSKPHVHESEQLNYVLSGEIYIFTEDQAFHLQEGDFLRIPPNVVHWAWNRSDRDCELIESHAPPLEILPREQATVLLGESEDAAHIRWRPNIFVDDHYLEREAELLAKLAETEPGGASAETGG